MFKIARKVRDIESEESGFTIVELIIALVLLSIFMAGVVLVISQGYTFFGSHRAASALNREGASSLDRIENLLRGAQYFDNAGTNATQVTFRADVDSDASNGTELLVIYRDVPDGNKIMLKIDERDPVSIGDDLNTGVSNPLEFTYYSDWAHTSTITDSYQESLKSIKVAINLTKASSGVRMNRSYSRYVILKLDPDDRNDNPPAI